MSVDEMTSLQPRPRTTETKPARPDKQPVLLEHEYGHKGAWNLFAAFDIQTGKVIGTTRRPPVPG
ncbi:MAG: hypothetical protein GY811_20755 [Myxococcales bacterium]|nr:hypothetical protein [Myxococcales bacterium]